MTEPQSGARREFLKFGILPENRLRQSICREGFQLLSMVRGSRPEPMKVALPPFHGALASDRTRNRFQPVQKEQSYEQGN